MCENVITSNLRPTNVVKPMFPFVFPWRHGRLYHIGN